MKMIKMNFMQSSKTFVLIAIFSISLAVGSFLAFSPADAQLVMPAVEIGVSPGSISCGGSATLSWTSNDASSVEVSGFGSVELSGSRTVSPSSTTTYSITGTNSTGGSASASTTLDVGSCNTYSYQYQTPSYGYQTPSSYGYQTPSSYSYQTPNTYSYQTPSGNQVTVTLTADDTSIDEGDSTVVRWTSTNATSCTASGGTNGWSGSRATSGSFNTGDLNDDKTYNIICQNSTSSDNDSVTIRVNDDNNNSEDDAPDVETRSATDITLTSATLNGRVDGNGCSTHAWFEYSTNRNDISDEETDEQSTGSGIKTFNERITGLRSDTTYYFRAVAENCEDDDTGSIFSFRTAGLSIYSTPYGTPSSYSYQTPVASSGSALLLISSTVDRHQPIIPSLDNTCPLPGDEIGYTLRYQNVGNRAVTSATLQLNLPMEVDYLYSDPNNPSIFGNTLIFNLGTISAGEEGVVSVRVRVRENAPAGTLLNFPALLSYIDPSGQPRSVTANVSAEVWCTKGVSLGLGANVFGAGFFPATILGWLFLILLILLLAYLVRQVFQTPPPAAHTEVTHHYPPAPVYPAASMYPPQQPPQQTTIYATPPTPPPYQPPYHPPH